MPCPADGPRTAAQVVNHLRSRGAVVIERRGYWMVKCPAHHDRQPSLKVRPGHSQPVVLKCLAGCSQDAVLAAAGLSWADVLARSESRKPAVVVSRYRCDEHRYSPLDDDLLNLVFDLKPPQVERDVVEGPRAGDHGPLGALFVEQPKRAGKVMRAVLADIVELVGLRAGEGESRPVPYASRWAARRISGRVGFVVDDRRVRDAVRRLVKAGALAESGALPRTDGRAHDPTPLFALGVSAPCPFCALAAIPAEELEAIDLGDPVEPQPTFERRHEALAYIFGGEDPPFPPPPGPGESAPVGARSDAWTIITACHAG